MASVAIATVETVAIRTPAMISGTASGISTLQRSCRSVIPIPRPASLAELGHVAEPDDDVAIDDLEVVERQPDHRRRRAAPGDRQEQQEERDARDRVEDPGAADEDGDEPAAAVGDDREEQGEHEPGDDGDADEEDVLERRRDVVVDVVDDVVRAEALVLADARRRPLARLADVDLGERQRARRAWRSGQWPLGGRVLLDLRLGGGEELAG